MQLQGVWQGGTCIMCSTPHLAGACPAIPKEIAKTWCLISVDGGQWPRKTTNEQLHNWQTPHLSETQQWNDSWVTSPLQLYQDAGRKVLTLGTQNDLLAALNITSCSLSVSLYGIKRGWKTIIFYLSTGANGNFVKVRKLLNCKPC